MFFLCERPLLPRSLDWTGSAAGLGRNCGGLCGVDRGAVTFIQWPIGGNECHLSPAGIVAATIM